MEMPRPLNKSQLLIESQKEYAALEKLLTTLTPEQMIFSGTPGEWSVKDYVAHLYEWQQMFFNWYQAGLCGEIPCVPAQGYKWSQLPALNQSIYEKYRDYPLSDVLSMFRESHCKTIQLIERLSENDLTTRALYNWMNQNALIAYLAANTSSHYHWAIKEIRKMGSEW
jgi:hypothetical protein